MLAAWIALVVCQLLRQCSPQLSTRTAVRHFDLDRHFGIGRSARNTDIRPPASNDFFFAAHGIVSATSQLQLFGQPKLKVTLPKRCAAQQRRLAEVSVSKVVSDLLNSPQASRDNASPLSSWIERSRSKLAMSRGRACSARRPVQPQAGIHSELSPERPEAAVRAEFLEHLKGVVTGNVGELLQQ